LGNRKEEKVTEYKSRCGCLFGNPPKIWLYPSIEEFEEAARRWNEEWDKLVGEHEEKCKCIK